MVGELYTPVSRATMASLIGVGAFAVSFLFLETTLVPVVEGAIVGVVSYFSLYFNEKNKGTTNFVVSFVGTLAAMLVLWFNGLQNYVAVGVGLSLTFLGSMLWYYLSSHESE